MKNTNFLNGIVKILGKPSQKIINGKILKIKYRAELTQIKKNKVVNLVFWKKQKYYDRENYEANDCIIIEGYVSIRNKIVYNIINDQVSKQNLQKIEISILTSFFV